MAEKTEKRRSITGSELSALLDAHGHFDKELNAIKDFKVRERVNRMLVDARAEISAILAGVGEIQKASDLRDVCKMVRTRVSALKEQISSIIRDDHKVRVGPLNVVRTAISNSFTTAQGQVTARYALAVGDDDTNAVGKSDQFFSMCSTDAEADFIDIGTSQFKNLLQNFLVNPAIERLIERSIVNDRELISRDDFQIVSQYREILFTVLDETILYLRGMLDSDGDVEDSGGHYSKLTFADLYEAFLGILESKIHLIDDVDLSKLITDFIHEKPDMSDADFLAIGEAPVLGNWSLVSKFFERGSDTADLLLPKTRSAIAVNLEAKRLQGPDYTSSLDPQSVSDEEVDRLFLEWEKKKSGTGDFLNSSGRRELGVILNNEFHGGLVLRGSSDVMVLMRYIRLKKVREKERKVLNEQNERKDCKNLLIDGMNRYMQAIFDFMSARLLAAAAVDGGSEVTLSKEEFERFCVSANLVYAALVDSAEMMEVVTTNVERMKARFQNDAANAEISSIAKRHFGNDVDCDFDPNFILGAISNESFGNGKYKDVERMDVKTVAAQYVFPGRISDVLLKAEREFLTTQVELAFASDQSLVDIDNPSEVLDIWMQAGKLTAMVEVLNDELNGGLPVRSIDGVKGFVSVSLELLLQQRIPKKTKERLTVEQKAKILELISWVEESFPDRVGNGGETPGRYNVVKGMILVLYKFLKDELEVTPVYLVEHYVRCLELIRSKSNISDDGSFRNELRGDDLTVILSLPASADYSSMPRDVDAFMVMLRQVESFISQHKDLLVVVARLRSELQVKSADLAALGREKSRLDSEKGFNQTVLRERFSAMETVWQEAKERLSVPDQATISRITGEISLAKASLDAATNAIGVLVERETRISGEIGQLTEQIDAFANVDEKLRQYEEVKRMMLSKLEVVIGEVRKLLSEVK